MALELMPHQEVTVDFGVKNKYIINALDMGLGKAQPLDSLVLTPTGFIKMSEVTVGSIVMGKDGNPKKVLGVYPQGSKKVFKVHFTDETYVECCEDHLWEVQTAPDTYRGKDFRVKSTKELSTDLRNKHNYKWKIPICKPVRLSKNRLEIPPYLLGVLIGDGSLAHDSINITNASDHIYSRVFKDATSMGMCVSRRWVGGGNTYTINIVRPKPVGRNRVKEILEHFKLDVTSYYKYIPEEYLTSDIEDRVNLLQGLLDTDGYVAKDGTIQFTSSSERLVIDVISLCQSLGGVATKQIYKLTNFETDCWTTTLKIPSEIVPVTKPEKKDRLKKEVKYPPARFIARIEDTGEYKECQCISVEGQTYITNNYAVTHNTLCAIETSHRVKAKCLIICPAYLKLKWKKEIHKFHPEKVVSVLDNPKQFYALWDTDYCVISYSFLEEAEILFEWAEMVVIDESHQIKEMDTKRTLAAHKLIYENNPKYLQLLTGTPIQNRVYEFYSLLCMVHYTPDRENNGFLEKFPTYVDFAERYSHLHEYKITVTTKKGKLAKVPVKKWSGIKNKEELKQWLKGCYIRYNSEDVLDLPEAQDIFVPVEYKDIPELQEEFEKYKGDDSGVTPRVKIDSALAKCKFTVEYARSLLDQGLPVVIFTDHVESCEAIAKELKVPAITGKTSTDRRDKLANDFQSGKTDIIVATILSFSTGNDLQRSSDMIFNDYNWVPGNNKQAKFRIIRIGQFKRCRFHYMIGSKQDEFIYGANEDKLKVINQIVR
jgi:hypothetical protein